MDADVLPMKIHKNKGMSFNRYRRNSNNLQNQIPESWNRNKRHNDSDRISHQRGFQRVDNIRQPLMNRYDSFPSRHRHERVHWGDNRRGERNGPLGCFNCGERNHQVATCRFDHKLRCGTCEQLGHKSKICPYSNQNRNY